MRTLIIILTTFFIPILSAQDATEVLTKSKQAIEALQTVSYHVDIQQTNPMNADTSQLSSDCFIKLVPIDTIVGMYYYFSTVDSGFDKYNGLAFYSYSPEYYNYIVRYTVKDNPEKFRPMNLPIGIVPSEVTSSFTYLYSLINTSKDVAKMLDYAESRDKSFHFTPDTLLDNRRCFFFKISKSTQKSSWYQSVFIDQSTFLPVYILQNSTGGSIMIGDKNVSVSQFTKRKYSKIEESAPKIDYLLSENSLPKDVEISDHRILLDHLKKGDPAPSWKHPEVSTDKLISLDSLRGKIVVLDFISTWCFHCVEGSLVIKELFKKYSDNKDLVFVNVFSCKTDTKEKIQRYIKMRNIDGLTIYQATSSEKPYGIFGYPNFCIIDRQGKIAFFQGGYSTNLQELLSKEIDQCLGE